MSKKSDEHEKAKDDNDLDDEESDEETDDDEEDEGDDEEQDDEEEAEVAPSAGASRARARTQVHAAHDDHIDDDGVESDGAEPEDPYWWAPHAVLSALVIIGVFGFFGLFNSTPLARLAAPVAPEPDETPAHEASPPPEPVRQLPAAPQAPRELFGAKHLLVMYKGSRRAPPNIERSKDEAKARAAEAMKKAKADPSKFADLVKEYSDEPGADKRGGDLGKFPKGSMVPEFQAGLEKIKVGDVSDLVETPFGYHVILRTQ